MQKLCQAQEQLKEELNALRQRVSELEAKEAEYKLAIETLEQSQQQFETLVNSVDGVLWEADPQTFQFTFVSQQVEQLLGYPSECWLNEETFWIDHIHPDDRKWAIDYCRQATLEKKNHDFEYRMFDSEGNVIWFRDIVTVMVENEQPVKLRGVMVDITKRKQLEEQVRQTQKLEAVGELAAGVAHNFNNMLTAIMGYTDFALAGLPPSHPVSQDLHGIEKTTKRAADMVKQLLAFSRYEESEPTVLNLGQVIAQMQSVIQTIVKSSIKLEVDIEPDVACIYIDPDQLKQVILNVILNARDAMPNGGTLSIAVQNELVDQNARFLYGGLIAGRYVLLKISDTGVGMTPEVQARVFEPFFTTKMVGQGSGLGLATCLGIIKQNKGHISVQSEPDQGATVMILLPGVD